MHMGAQCSKQRIRRRTLKHVQGSLRSIHIRPFPGMIDRPTEGMAISKFLKQSCNPEGDSYISHMTSCSLNS